MRQSSGKSAHPSQRFEEETIAEIRARLIEWGQGHYRPFPWRALGTPLWQALISEFLLLRTRAAQVAPIFERLQVAYPDMDAIRAATDQELETLVAPLGLRWRGALFVRLMRAIAEQEGQIPTDERLRDLPGVGDYVASATLALHVGERAVLIDSNIVRLLARLVGAPFNGETRRKRWLRELADRLTPPSGGREYGYAILDHSMTICVPRNPRCADCPLFSMCRSARPA